MRLKATKQGSSLLTRGKQRCEGSRRTAAGLIPAHARKTFRINADRQARRAHPRSRGDNQVQVLKAHFGDGSSPLTRGKLADDIHVPGLPGLIPAHAGKTS